MPSLPEVLLVARYVVTAIGAIMVKHGWATDGDIEVLAGLVMAIAPIILAWITNRQQHAAIINAAATGVPVQPGPLAPTSPIVQEDNTTHA